MQNNTANFFVSVWRRPSRRPWLISWRNLALIYFAVSIAPSASYGQSGYNLDIIAKTGDKTPNGETISSLGWGASINDAGKVAFKAHTKEGHDFVLARQESTLEDRTLLARSFSVSGVSFDTRDFSVGDAVQINNHDQVIWNTRSPDGLFVFILRVGSTSADGKIVAKNRYVRLDSAPVRLDSPFDYAFPFPSKALSPWVTMNNSGRAIFSATLYADTSLTVLATPKDILRGGTSVIDDYYRSGWFPNLPEFYPMVSDDGHTVVRAGGQATDPLVIFGNETLVNGSSSVIAGPALFRAVGEKPGISDDGRFIGFMGDHILEGAGIYGQSDGVFKVAGLDRFSSFSLRPRVGVNRTHADSSNQYTFTYLATGPKSSSTQLGPLGLYATEVTLNTSTRPKIGEPIRILQVGDAVPELSGTVQDIAPYDPINNGGQVAFWLRTSADIQAIARASALPRKSGVDLSGFIAWENLEGRMLPDVERKCNVTIQNLGSEAVVGTVKFQIFLSPDKNLALASDLMLASFSSYPINLDGGSAVTLPVMIKLAASTTPGLDKAGLRYLILRLEPNSGINDNDTSNNVIASDGFWMGEVISVITHGFNPRPPEFPSPIGEPWEKFRQTGYNIAAAIKNLPEPDSLLHNRTAEYVSEWESSHGFWIAFTSLIISKIAEANANDYLRHGDIENWKGNRDKASFFKQVALQQAPTCASYFEAGANQVYAALKRQFLLSNTVSRDFQILHFIGHSRGGALNGRVAQMLLRDGYKVNEFTALDGFAKDWPDDGGLIGDSWLAQEAFGADSKVNYRVEQNLASVIVDIMDAVDRLGLSVGLGEGVAGGMVDAIIHFVAKQWRVDDLPSPLFPNKAARGDLAKLDLRAPNRGPWGFQDVFLRGEGDPATDYNLSHHLNIQDLYLRSLNRRPTEQYLLNNFLGAHRKDPIPLGGLTGLRGPRTLRLKSRNDIALEDAGSFSAVNSTSASESRAIRGLVDGDFEVSAAIVAESQRLVQKDSGIGLIDGWLHVLSNPAAVLALRWNVSGDVRLLTVESNAFVQLIQTTNTSIGQFLVLYPGTKRVGFDLSVLQTGPESALELIFGSKLLQRIPLSGYSRNLQHVVFTLPTTGSGDFTFRLAGNPADLSTIQLDNLSIVYEPPKIISTESKKNGEFKFSISGAAGERYAIDVSEDAVIWHQIGEIENGTGNAEFRDTDTTTSPHRFYRVRITE